MNDLPHNDQPIESPAQDRFGFDPFASTLAGSIRKLKSPNGSVIALNGPWGSGKSSALNLIRHHLGEAITAGEIIIIDFNCWWFRGEEALALAFFRELYAGMSPTLGGKLKKVLPKLGARLLRAGSAVGGAVDLAGAGGAGAVVGGTMEWLSGLIQQDESVEKLHADLSKTLIEQQCRFLVVIDDIDRLSPDEALLIFRLVKSVGRLPNVMYLLVYDRLLAEKIVSERFPSEGPHYLEKIVQAAFELPEPLSSDVKSLLLTQIGEICGTPEEDRMVRFMNLFYEAIAPEIRTPRDIARFANSLSVTWPAVAGEVDTGDFVTLEILRLMQPEIYRALRQNKDWLCKESTNRGKKDDLSTELDKKLLGSIAPDRRGRYRRGLMRLFPVLESVWSNMHYSPESAKRWAKERRACSSAHFDSYFRFTIGSEILSAKELSDLIERIDDQDFVIQELRNAITVTRASGGTKASVILSELDIHADNIDSKQVQPFLTALFMVADDINVEADRPKGFSIGDNQLRLHWLIRNLTFERMPLAERSAVFVQACKTAALGWLANFVDSAWADHHPREGKEPELNDNCLTTTEDAAALRDMLHHRIAEAAAKGMLLNSQDLARLLYLWAELEDDDGQNVKAWTAAQMATDEGIRCLVAAFTSYSWTQGLGMVGLGDLVAKRNTRAQVNGLSRVLDVLAFRERVEQQAGAGNNPEISAFLEAWKAQEQHEDG